MSGPIGRQHVFRISPRTPILALFACLVAPSVLGPHLLAQPASAGKSTGLVYVLEVVGYAGRIDKILGRFKSYEEAQAAGIKWSQSNPDDLRLYNVREVGGTPPLGSLSKKYEVARGGPETISTGKIKQKDRKTGKTSEVDDLGGKSYGSYQMASKRGVDGSTVASFVARYYPSDFEGLKPGSEPFNSKWTEIVNRDRDAFRETEQQFIRETHYDPVAEALQQKIGLDLSIRSRALQDAVWSTAVQHGPPDDPKGHAVSLLLKAFDPWTAQPNADWSKVADKDLINAVYDERGRKTDDGKMVHFPNLEKLDRFDQERRDALIELKHERADSSSRDFGTPLVP